jgi:hypothetical protein
MIASMIKIIFLLITLNIKELYTLPCDKVAMLPPDFNNLIPEADKLQKIHLHQFFFLDEPDGQNANPNSIKIDIKERSVFKVQITPKLSDLKIEIRINGKEPTVLETSDDIPVEYTSTSLDPGTLELNLSTISSEENKKAASNVNPGELVCNTPYIVFEIYLEKIDIFNQRIKLTKTKTAKIDDLSDLTEFFESAAKRDAYPIKSGLKTLNVKLTELTNYKKEYLISVLNEFDLNIPDSKLTDDKTVTHEKVFLKFQIYADFYLFGSFHLLLIRTSDIEDSLTNLECLNDGRCVLANHPSKNSQILETILTPGDYKVLLVNLGDDNAFKALGKVISDVPISAQLKLKRYEKVDNHFNCEGRRLPKDFDYLFNPDDNVFEFKADLIPNLQKLFDSVDFNVNEDSLLRVVTTYNSGNYIDTDLFKINDLGEEEKITTTSNKSEEEDCPNCTEEHLSHTVGDVDGLYRSLTKGKYRLRFNYAHSFFIETDRRTCETFNVKIGIEKISYIKSILGNLNTYTACSSKLEKDKLDDLFRNIEKTDIQSNSDLPIYSVEYSTKNVNSYIYSTTFELTGPHAVNVEVLSDDIAASVIPIIVPVNKNNTPLSNSLNNLTQDKLKLHDDKLSVKLAKGKYYLSLFMELLSIITEEAHRSK